jgi:N-acyl-D-amino-acid deacylase
VRTLVCGFTRNRVDDLQRKLIQAEIRTGLEAGAVALSTGLDYQGQIHATTDELVDAAAVLKEFNAPYVTHVRYKLGLLPAVKEAVEIGRRAGVKVHISHLKPHQPEQVEQLLEYIDRVARHEVDFSFDVYPYLPGSTMLNFLLPYEAWDGGPLAVLGQLNNPVLRSRFRRTLDNYRVPLDGVHIAWLPGKENAQYQGWLLSDYCTAMGKPPEEALLNLLIEERLAVLCVFNEGDDALSHAMLQHDLGMIGSDAIYHDDACVHPRAYGTAPRILGRCVRDWKLFSLEDAVYKLAGAAAQRFQLTDRGRIAVGKFADLVVFHPATVHDPATFAEPRQYPIGIPHVIVNGQPIVRGEQALTPEALPGRSLKRGE